MPYVFGATSFANFVWLDHGQPFSDPASMDIEMVNAGAFAVEVIRPNGTLAGRALAGNPHGGWSTFDFKYGGVFGPGIPDGVYRIRLVNAAPGVRQAKQGDLWGVGERGALRRDAARQDASEVNTTRLAEAARTEQPAQSDGSLQ